MMIILIMYITFIFIFSNYFSAITSSSEENINFEYLKDLELKHL